ncbi:MAG: histidine--tRNA ligase [bacterium]|nr:histidine--tRNA ligase [bacterium]
MKLTSPRGTKDILPDEISLWHEIEQVSRDLFDRYNFDEIRTPIFESTELFTRGIGDNTDIVEKEMYTFEDKGGRSLTLRPEGTASIVRSYLEHNLEHTQTHTKFYYSGPMFRYERPQAGRFRQFHQIGVEHLNTTDPISDAEVIALGIHIFDELGLPDLSVTINSVGCPTCRPVIEERIKQFLGDSITKLCGDCQRRYNEQPLRILDCKKETCRNYLSGMKDIRSSHCQECRDHFEAVLEYLDVLGVEFNIDPKLVRGLDYYTRTTFEIVSNKLGAQNALCGGGRYDYLVESLGGKHTPAVGFAFGEERTVMLLKDLVETYENALKVYMIPLGQPQRCKCFVLENNLRRAGVKCELGTTDNLKAQFKKADRMKAQYVLIFGEEEAERNIGILKNMKTGEQTEVPITKLEKTIKGL